MVVELYYISATEALKKFKNKTLSPVELIKAIIDRAEKINPKINAHNFTFYEKAIKSAKKSEEKYSSNKKKGLITMPKYYETKNFSSDFLAKSIAFS